MSSSSKVSPLALAQPVEQPQLATLGWALRRAVLGLLLLAVLVTLGAWLLYASIDPDEAVASAPPAGQTAAPQR